MQTIEYKVTYASGHYEYLCITARTINSGFGKALRAARDCYDPELGTKAEIARIEFFQVR